MASLGPAVTVVLVPSVESCGRPDSGILSHPSSHGTAFILKQHVEAVGLGILSASAQGVHSI